MLGFGLFGLRGLEVRAYWVYDSGFLGFGAPARVRGWGLVEALGFLWVGGCASLGLCLG